MQFFQYAALLSGILSQILIPQIQTWKPEIFSESVRETQEIFREIKEEVESVRLMTVLATGYSSTHDQTDDTPFITASNKNVEDGIVACNFLPFGTAVRFPEIYGDKIFVVEDRMAKKFNDRVDIWFETRSNALEFGVKNTLMEVL